MALELNRLTGQVEEMGRSLARRQHDQEELARQASDALACCAEVTDELRQKIHQARTVDTSWRGAEPLGDRLDERYPVPPARRSLTLIAADGSQIYPNRHAIATYFLINIGHIVLRAGSGQAPAVATLPTLHFTDRDLYDQAGRLRDPEYINRLRDRQEIETLAEAATAERTALGGDTERAILAMMDGPLLMWAREQGRDADQAQEVADALRHFTGCLSAMRQAQAVPIGYIDRPSSALVVRTLELTQLPPGEISRDAVRRRCFGQLTDRGLFATLAPGERTGLFASTARTNQDYQTAGHRIAFCYMNLARRPGPEHAIIARVEMPEWAAGDLSLLDTVQQGLYADCELTGFPYVLARAHELAVVGNAERASFEEMVQRSMWRNGLRPALSDKAEQKRLTRSGQRR